MGNETFERYGWIDEGYDYSLGLDVAAIEQFGEYDFGQLERIGTSQDIKWPDERAFCRAEDIDCGVIEPAICFYTEKHVVAVEPVYEDRDAGEFDNCHDELHRRIQVIRYPVGYSADPHDAVYDVPNYSDVRLSFKLTSASGTFLLNALEFSKIETQQRNCRHFVDRISVCGLEEALGRRIVRRRGSVRRPGVL